MARTRHATEAWNTYLSRPDGHHPLDHDALCRYITWAHVEGEDPAAEDLIAQLEEHGRHPDRASQVVSQIELGRRLLRRYDEMERMPAE